MFSVYNKLDKEALIQHWNYHFTSFLGKKLLLHGNQENLQVCNCEDNAQENS